MGSNRAEVIYIVSESIPFKYYHLLDYLDRQIHL